jgi:GT2 family glycosyltransferase
MMVSKYTDIEHLASALGTLVYQNRQPDQVVIIQNGDTDADVDKVIDEYRELLPVISPKVPAKKRAGDGAALNIGIKTCDHDLIAHADAESLNDIDRFDKQIRFMDENPHVTIVGSALYEIDNWGHIGALRKPPTTHHGIIKNVWRHHFLHPTVVYRRDAVLSIGGYRTDLSRGHDSDLWLRAAKAGFQLANSPEALVLCRTSQRRNLGDIWRGLLTVFSQPQFPL